MWHRHLANTDITIRTPLEISVSLVKKKKTPIVLSSLVESPFLLILVPCFEGGGGKGGQEDTFGWKYFFFHSLPSPSPPPFFFFYVTSILNAIHVSPLVRSLSFSPFFFPRTKPFVRSTTIRSRTSRELPYRPETPWWWDPRWQRIKRHLC